MATKKPKRSTLRLRQYWRRIMRNRRLYYSAVLTSRPSNDIRSYADVTILGERVSGLIGTGATVSCLASDFAWLAQSVEHETLNLRVVGPCRWAPFVMNLTKNKRDQTIILSGRERPRGKSYPKNLKVREIDREDPPAKTEAPAPPTTP